MIEVERPLTNFKLNHALPTNLAPSYALYNRWWAYEIRVPRFSLAGWVCIGYLDARVGELDKVILTVKDLGA